MINDELIYKKDFDMDTVKYAILSKLNPGCFGPSPDVIILEPGANLNSNEEILRVAEMYKNDFSIEDHSFLDIVTNEAIYHRLIRCQDKWPKIRPILGQWHMSEDFCLVLIVLFSSYRLLSFASRLGVQFLDKFEMVVNYHLTARVLDLIWVAVGVAISIYINNKGMTTSEIIDGNNNENICLKIWYMYFKWAEIWKAYQMAIRIENFDLQRDALSAASPLFTSAAKFNYTIAIAHFLSTIVAYPKFEEKLRYCCSFKIPNKNFKNAHPTYFGFDEALETFGVKFVKQHVNGNVIDEKTLKNQIKGIQDERERIDLLMSEYLKDHFISSSERAIKSHKESLWELIHDLVTIFGMKNPLSHLLFEKYSPTEMHKESLDRLIACYLDRLERIKKVYLQEVLQTERKNTQGRRTAEVIRTKIKDYNQKKIREKKIRAENYNLANPTEPTQIVIAESSNKRQFDLNDPCSPETTEPRLKKRKTTGSRHHTTKDETDILTILKVYKDKPPDDAIANIYEHLSNVWTIKKV
ncbi:hypothetical protein GLOIN_2v1482460 [Rhizophagus clarus]|uniref:Uncharacterized protein n=2 Tax=Rhizophagus clarus TaxID=94130 RepID=A0A8H3MBF7_9GLOM|nr:hypothetical protein GLOIN_2v1482460 [Rhizophagus clarus]